MVKKTRVLKNYIEIEKNDVTRSTYLVNPEGKISYMWPKVRVKGHVEEVKAILAGL